MWRFIIVTVTLALSSVIGRPLDSLEDPYWSSRFIKFPSKSANNVDIVKKWPRENTMNSDYLLDETQMPYIKRGFSMLARWRPFSNIGKQRSSIREANRIPINDLDIVSAETRAMLRPIGQPLRWG